MKGGISAGWGLVGVIAGSWVTGHHQRIERRNARIKEQLMEFYAPLRIPDAKNRITIIPLCETALVKKSKFPTSS